MSSPLSLFCWLRQDVLVVRVLPSVKVDTHVHIVFMHVHKMDLYMLNSIGIADIAQMQRFRRLVVYIPQLLIHAKWRVDGM